MAAYWVLLGMVVVFAVLTRLRVSTPLAFVGTAVAGVLLGGFGLAPRQLLDGMFGYFYLVLVLFAGAIYNRWMRESGVSLRIAQSLGHLTKGRRTLLLLAAAALVYVAGMLSGIAGVAVLFAGAIIVPVLLALGLRPEQAAALLSIEAILGMVGPPINLPAAMIADGINMPYMEFNWVLLALSLPLAVFSALYIGRSALKGGAVAALDEVAAGDASEADAGVQSGGLHESQHLGAPSLALSWAAVGVPLLIWVLVRLWPNTFHDPSVPLVLLVGAVIALIAGRGRFRPLQAAYKELSGTVLQLGAVLVGVGMLVQVLSLTGARGWIVINSMSLQPPWTYLAILLSMPILGGVLTSIGSASILGVPFAFIFIDRDMVVNASALSMMAGLAEMMPPTSIAAILAGYLCGEMNLRKIWRHAAVPMALIAIVSLLALVFSHPLGLWLR